jgi:hypothetical protein
VGRSARLEPEVATALGIHRFDDRRQDDSREEIVRKMGVFEAAVLTFHESI